MQMSLLLALFLALICGAIFSSVETAIVAIPESKLTSLAKRDLWAKYALKLKKELQKVLIFNLFGNSLANAALTTVSTAVFLSALGDVSSLSLTLVTLFITFVIIVFSEATPKVIASKSPTKVLRIFALPIYSLFILSKPVIWFIDLIVYSITRLFSLHSKDKVSLDEVRSLVLDHDTPFMDEHRKIVKNTIDFDVLLVKDIVIPLRYVEMIDINDGVKQNIERLKSAHHSNVIIYENTIDNIIGYIKVRDILTIDNMEEQLQISANLIRKISYIHDFMPTINYLPDMQREREFISVVVNEYGNILGIATVVDMVELIFGPLASDALFSSYLIVKNTDDSYTVDGIALIRDINLKLNINLPISFCALSINGLLLKVYKAVPTVNICIKIGNVIFEILQVNKFGVEKVKLIRLP